MDARPAVPYHPDVTHRVHVLTDDLFFRAKIEATGAAAGVPVDFAATVPDLIILLEQESVRPSGAQPPLVLVDLGHRAVDPPAAIRVLKARSGAPTVVAFGAHRDREAFQAARDAGADRVLARSAFSEHLPDLLAGAGRG